MKILHVINSLDQGGAQTLLESLLQELDEEQHVVVLLGPDQLSERIEAVAASVTYLRLSKRTPNLAKARKRLNEFVRRNQFKVVNSHLIQADLLTLISGLDVPIVSTVHTSGGHESSAPSRLVSKLVAKRSTGFAKVVACSSAAKSFVEGVPYAYRGEIKIINNGVHVEEVITSPAIPCFTALNMSRWHPMKDHRTLIEAFSIARREWAGTVRLVLAGQEITPDNPDLMRLIREFEIDESVEIAGPVSNVTPLITSASVYVSSSSHGEALPMAGIEALAHGVPVLTTDVGSCGELGVAPEFVVPPRDARALADGLLEVIGANESLTEEWREAAHQLAQSTFSVARAAEEYRELYAESIGSAP